MLYCVGIMAHAIKHITRGFKMSKLFFVLIVLFLYTVLVAAIFSTPVCLFGQLVAKAFVSCVISLATGGVLILQVRDY